MDCIFFCSTSSASFPRRIRCHNRSMKMIEKTNKLNMNVCVMAGVISKLPVAVGSPDPMTIGWMVRKSLAEK